MITDLLFVAKYFEYHNVFINELIENGVKVYKIDCDINDIELFITKFQPDILLIDTNNQKTDLLMQLFNDIMKFNFQPDVFMISSYDDYYTHEELYKFKIQAVFSFPYLSKNLSNYILSYTKVNPHNINNIKQDLNDTISNTLKKCGLNSGMNSFWYIRHAIYMCCLIDDTKISFSTMIYPELASKFDCSASSVEWAIRNSINKNGDIIQKVFDNEKSYMEFENKLTNTKFIKLVTSIIKKDKYITIEKLKRYDNIKNHSDFVIE